MTTNKIVVISTVCYMLLFINWAAVGASRDELTIRGENLGNWWILGDTVTFKPKTNLPPKLAKVTGTVFDSTGEKIGAKTISAATFMTKGWKWQPKQVGFYRVEFHWDDNAGITTHTQETINCNVYKWIKGKPHLRFQKDFFRKCHNFAVLPSPSRPPDEIPAQMAISLGPAHEKKEFRIKWANDNIKLAALMGFHSVRIHTIAWTMLEPQQGKYDWHVLDEFIAEAQKNGFKDFIGNPFGTPQWASTHPEKINYNICVWEYAAFAPKKMVYWSNFLKALVKRYPFIKTWELWNEPHLPGQSCFWSDSPENFVQLLKSGYQAIKEIQPDSTIWLAGIGMRYLPFYKKIIALGADNYFDVLALHGSWASPLPFQRIDQAFGNDSKPWVSSEWHAMLTGESKPVTPSDESLTRRMLIDFMNHIRQGAEVVTFFTTSNIPHGREQEMMDFFRKNKQFHQTYGLFRATPYFEPRLMAVVWRNFSDCFAGKISYSEGYYFDESKQQAALMHSERGNVLFFWSNSESPEKLHSKIKAAVGDNSILLDWEGRPIELANLELRPNVVYFLKHPNIKIISNWTECGQVLKPQQKEPKLDQAFQGYYHQGRLFDETMNTIDIANVPWQQLTNYIPVEAEKPAEGFGARFAVSVNEKGMDILANVSDRIYAQTHNDGNIWMGDSIQIALDTVGKGLPEDRLEISAALTPNGPLLWKESMPSMNGDLPDKITNVQQPLKYGKMVVEKTSNGLCYKIHIDRHDLYPYTYLPGHPLRISILVNNNDGTNRLGYLEWASGIGKTKDPALYGTMTVYVGQQTLFQQSNLKEKWGTATLDHQDNIVKVFSPGGHKKAAAVMTTEAIAIPGARYQISFMARGNITLYGMGNVAFGKQHNKRHDFLKGHKLTGNWKPFKMMFTIPLSANKLRMSLFCWEEKGEFEIKNFKMVSGQQEL